MTTTTIAKLMPREIKLWSYKIWTTSAHMTMVWFMCINMYVLYVCIRHIHVVTYFIICSLSTVFSLRLHILFEYPSSLYKLFFYILLVYGLKWTARNIDDLHFFCMYFYMCMYVCMFSCIFVFIYICIQRAVYYLWLEKILLKNKHTNN